MMQQLLTGKKRFPGFTDEWEEVQLGDVGIVVTGNTPSTKISANYGNEYMFVSPIDLGKSKYIVKTSKYLSEKGFSISRKIPQACILYTCIGSTIGKIGIAGSNLVTNQQINSIVPFSEFYGEFIYYQLLFNTPEIRLLAGEQAVPLINKTEFEKVNLAFPKLKEQQKIASFLSIIDQEIEVLEKKLEAMRTQKWGLMQQLLTGEIRVKM